jgi:hypothetical protein
MCMFQQEALQNSPPFTVRLGSVGSFQHPLSSMLWAGPKSGEYELRYLHYVLTQLFPHGGEGGEELDNQAVRDFTPHLCLGQWRCVTEMEEAKEQIQSSWKTVEWDVSQVNSIARCRQFVCFLAPVLACLVLQVSFVLMHACMYVCNHTCMCVCVHIRTVRVCMWL